MCRYSSVRIVTLTVGWMIEELGSDDGQRQTIIINSQLLPLWYWNLNLSYALDNWDFSRGGQTDGSVKLYTNISLLQDLATLLICTFTTFMTLNLFVYHSVSFIHFSLPKILYPFLFTPYIPQRPDSHISLYFITQILFYE